MKPFSVKSEKLTGGLDDKEIMKRAQDYLKSLLHKTKRQPYTRSAYFNRKKIFFTYFWKHLYQKTSVPKKTKGIVLALCN
jgi:hypothetical protein